MPTSSANTIPVVMGVTWELSPRRVLDLGAGLGKYGVLFREYLECRNTLYDRRSEPSIPKDALSQRTVVIDAVEGCTDYIGDLHRSVYDHIFTENILDFIRRDCSYDLIFLCDVLEHFDKKTAQDLLLPRLLELASMGVLISVPARFYEQDAVCGNTLEIHRSSWTSQELRAAAPHAYVGRADQQLVAFLSRRPEPVQALNRYGYLGRKLRIIWRAMKNDWCF